MTKPYNFIYDDGQFMTFDLTQEEFIRVGLALGYADTPPYILISSGAIATKRLRFVKELKEEDIPPKDNETGTPEEYAMEEFMYTKKVDDGEDEDDGRPV